MIAVAAPWPKFLIVTRPKRMRYDAFVVESPAAPAGEGQSPDFADRRTNGELVSPRGRGVESTSLILSAFFRPWIPASAGMTGIIMGMTGTLTTVNWL